MNRQLISDVLRQTLLYLFFLAWIVLIGSFFFIDRNFNDAGVLAGKTAVTILWIVTIPGILKRFQVKGFLQSIQIVLMKSRRRLGILMFTLALMHASWVRLFIYINFKYIPSIWEFNVYELLGITALTILMPLFVTSNSFSVRNLKKNWDRIHYLIYPAMWLIAFHIALQGDLKWAVPTFVFAGLQVLSRIYAYRMKKIAPPIPAAPTVPTTTPRTPIPASPVPPQPPSKP